ncbi:pilus assembly protein TadG-related protein [Nitratireductor sp. ZSWI3]|uniref:pilus assembly protein TadG-related protein n=1 Tax=Nitratireductor sp. ZSWI3 TaxID=2966359 RepID=UPI00214F627F|nr:pilus assembly protein TadG-related protein [Nitratireductor sp. ZSWI3]MCR4266011.1 pilus assembly protein TadG-related protein [Nitratireductor sp. ZSWI3]
MASIFLAHLRALLRDRRANVATLFALILPVMIGCLALGVDYGNLTLQQRRLQKTADLASIIAAADIRNAEKAVAKFFALNNEKIAVETSDGLLLDDRYLSAEDHLEQARNGIARLVRGRYFADPSIATSLRFVEMATSPDAAKVMIRKQGVLYFGSLFTSAPEIGVVGTASAEKLAGFSIGSRLASLDGGILNGVLGQLLGTTISLKAMDYEALLDADVNVLSFLQVLATRLNLTALTYDQILATDLTLPQLLSSLRLTSGVPPAVQAVLRTLETATSKNASTFKLEKLLNLDPKGPLTIATDAPWEMKIGVLEMITAAAALSNGDTQISIDSGINLLGLGAIRINLAIGEPPVGTPSHALAPIGTAVRTAQTRLKVEIEISGLQLLAGTKIRLPLYVEVAHAEARIADIQCSPSSATGGSVAIDAVPGVLEIAIGNVDPSVLSNFSTGARVTRAELVNAAGLVKITGIAHVESKNLQMSRLNFSSSDILQGRVKTVSTKDIIGSITATLLGKLDLDVRVLTLSLGLEPLFKAALAATLSSVAAPVDALLYNVLALAGVKVGEVDVRVTGVNCERPVLVQ